MPSNPFSCRQQQQFVFELLIIELLKDKKRSDLDAQLKHVWSNLKDAKQPIGVEDPANPVNKVFGGQQFQVTDQAFQFQEPELRDHLHVLLSIDVEKTGLAPNRRILPVRQQDKDFPMSWIRPYGKGRVFYSALGHGPQIFWNAPLLEHFLAGIQYALGDLKADDTPSARLRGVKE